MKSYGVKVQSLSRKADLAAKKQAKKAARSGWRRGDS